MKRRERTRQLIELGGLVVKASLVELTEDDRAAILGALLDVAVMLRTEQREEALLLWRRNGKRAFGAVGGSSVRRTVMSQGHSPSAPVDEWPAHVTGTPEY